MSALDERWADVDPDALADSALEAKRCECADPLVDGGMECLLCGRDIRAEGSLSRDFRTAAYMRRLSWAAGAGLPRSTGFRGLHGEVGANPPLDALQDALDARVEELLPTVGDPFEGIEELIPVALAA